MKEMRQDTRLTFLNRIPVMVLSLMSMTILTRWLGPDGNGIYTFIFTNIHLLLILFGLQTETAITHYLARSDADQEAEKSLGWIAVAVSTFSCAIFLWISGLIIPEARRFLVVPDQPYVYFLWFIMLSFLFRKSLNTTLAIQRASLKFRAYNRMQLVSQVVPAALYIYGFFILSRATKAEECLPVFNWILAGQGIIAIVGFIQTVPRTGSTFRIQNRIKPFYTYSFKSTIDALAKFINRRIDIYFVQTFRGMSALGQYGLASQINNFAQEIIHPFTQVMNPYLVKADQEERIDMMARMSRIIVSITTVLCIMIVVTSPLVIPILFGNAFAPSIAATQILAVSVVISTMRIIFASYFQSVNQLHINIRSNWLGVVITIILDVLLIPRYGIEGAAVASSMAYASSLMYLFIYIKKETQLSFRQMLVLKKSDVSWLLKKGESHT